MQLSDKKQDCNSSVAQTTFEDEDPQPLRYPSLPVYGALASANMTDPSLEDSTSALLDSSYEVIGESTVLSDNDGHNDGADSLASFSESAPSDISFEDTETLATDFPAVELPTSGHRAQALIDVELPDPSVSASGIDSASTSQTVTQSRTNGVQVSFPGSSGRADMTDFLNRAMGRPDSSSFRYHVDYADASDPLQFTGPFRIAYHGNISKQSEIIDKIAQAMVMSKSKEATTMDVVPIPSSDEGPNPPQVTLIPTTGHKIIVDVCNGSCCAKRLTSHLEREAKRRAVGMGQIHLQPDINAIKNFVDCPCYDANRDEKSEDEIKPDLAVFFHTTDQGQVAWNESSLACSMHLARQGIPVLDISDIRQRYPPQSFRPYGDNAPHFLVEDIKTEKAVGKMPLDLKSFLALDADGLNRNLALITGLDDPRTRGRSSLWTEVSKGFKDGFWETITNYAQIKDASTKTSAWKFGLGIFYLLAVSLMLTGWWFLAMGVASLLAGSSLHATPAGILLANITYVPALTTAWASSTSGVVVNPLTSYTPRISVNHPVATPKPLSDPVFAPFTRSEDEQWPDGVELNIYQNEAGRPYFGASKAFIKALASDVWFKVSTGGRELNSSLTNINGTFFEVDFGRPNITYGIVDLSLWIQGFPRTIWKLHQHHKSPPSIQSEIGRSLWDIRKAFQNSSFPESLILGQTLGYNMLTRAVQQVNDFARGTSAQFGALTVHLKEEARETTKALSKLADTLGTRVGKLARYPNPIAKAARKELMKVSVELTPYVDAVKETLSRNTAALRRKSTSLQLRERFVFPLKKAKDRATTLLGMKQNAKKKTKAVLASNRDDHFCAESL